MMYYIYNCVEFCNIHPTSHRLQEVKLDPVLFRGGDVLLLCVCERPELILATDTVVSESRGHSQRLFDNDQKPAPLWLHQQHAVTSQLYTFLTSYFCASQGMILT